MAFYNYRLPDGSYVQAPISASMTEVDAWARKEYPDAYKDSEPERKEERGFAANVKGASREALANAQLGIGSYFDEESARKSSRAERAKNQGIKTTSWEDVKKAYEQGITSAIPEGFAFARDTIAQSLPQTAATIAGVKAGAMGGAAIAPALGPLAPTAPIAGAILGGLAPNVGLMYGANLARQDQESPEVPLEKGKAGVAALGQGALDTASTLFLLGRLGVGKLAGKSLDELTKASATEAQRRLVAEAKRSLSRTVASGLAKGAAVEMPTEVAQQVLERWQAGLPVTGDEANKEYESAAAGAVVVGGALGGAGNIASRANARTRVDLEERQKASEEINRLANEEAEAEAVRKASPEYLLDIKQRHDEKLTELDNIQKQIKAFGKPDKGSLEEAEKKDLEDQRIKLINEFQPIKKEFQQRAKEIAQLPSNENLYSNLMSQPIPETPRFDSTQTIEIRKKLDDIIGGVQYRAQIGGLTPSGEEYVNALSRAPEAVRYAQENDIKIPGMSEDESRIIIRDAAKTQAKLAKQIADEHTRTKRERETVDTAQQTREANTRRGEEDLNDILNVLGTQPTTRTQATYIAPETGEVPQLSDQIAELESRIQTLDRQVKNTDPDKVYENGRVTEYGRRVALAQTQRDELVNELRALREQQTRRNTLAPEPISKKEDTLPKLLDETFGPSIDIDVLEAKLEQANSERRKKLREYNDFTTYLASLRRKLETVDSRLGDAARRRIEKAKGDRERLKRELSLLTLNQIKTAREAAGLYPLNIPDTALLSSINRKVDKAIDDPAKQYQYKQKHVPLLQKDTTEKEAAAKKIAAEQALRLNKKLEIIHKRMLDRIGIQQTNPQQKEYIDTAIRKRMLDRIGIQQTNPQQKEDIDTAIRSIERRMAENNKVIEEAKIYDSDADRQRALDRQLREVNQRIRLVERGGLSDTLKHSTGAVGPKNLSFSVEDAKRLISRLRRERDKIVAQQGLGYSEYELERRLQKIVDTYSIPKQQSLKTRITQRPELIAKLNKARINMQRAHSPQNRTKFAKEVERLQKLVNVPLQKGELIVDVLEAPKRAEKISSRPNELVLDGPQQDIYRSEYVRVLKAAMAQGMPKAKAISIAEGEAKRAAVPEEGTEYKDTVTSDLIEAGYHENIRETTAEVDLAERRVNRTEAELRREMKKRADELAPTDEGQLEFIGQKEAKELIRQEAEKAVSKLQKKVEAARAKKAAAVDDAIGGLLAEIDRKQTPEDKTRELTYTTVGGAPRAESDYEPKTGVTPPLPAPKKSLLANRVEENKNKQRLLAAQQVGEVSARHKAELPYFIAEAKRQKTEEAREKALAKRAAKKAGRGESVEQAPKNVVESKDVERVIAEGRKAYNIGIALASTGTNVRPGKQRETAKEKISYQKISDKDLIADAKRKFAGVDDKGNIKLNNLETLKRQEVEETPIVQVYKEGNYVDENVSVIRPSLSGKAAWEWRMFYDEKLQQLKRELAKKSKEFRKEQEFIRIQKEAEKYADNAIKTAGLQPATQLGVSTTKKGTSTRFSDKEFQGIEEDTDISDFQRQETLFSTQEKAPARPISAMEASKLFTTLRSRAPEDLKNRLKLYQTTAEIPQHLKDIVLSDGGNLNGQVKGALLRNGDILIVGDAHATLDDLKQTIAHEIFGHYGVRKLLGDKGLDMLVDRMSKNNGIYETAVALGTAGDTEHQAKRRAVSEILAHLEENVPTESVLEKIERFIHELIGAINYAFEQLGLRNSENLTLSDIRFMLARARRAAMRDDATLPDEVITYFRKNAEYEEGYKDLADVADKMVTTNRTVLERIKENVTGLGFRVRFVDNHAALVKAAKEGNPAAAMQLQYELMNYNNRNHYVNQFVMVGPVARYEWGADGGRTLFKTEATSGANLKNVMALLGEVKGVGNEKAVNEAFNMLVQAKRAKTVGWGKVNRALPESIRNIADRLANGLDAGKSPFSAAYKEYQAFHKGVLSFLQQSGVISESEFRRLAGSQNYTPLFRQRGNDVVLSLDANKDITVGSLQHEPHLKELLGDDTAPLDFFSASIQNTAFITELALRNLASRNAAFTLQEIGAAHQVGRAVKGPNIIEFRKHGEEDLQRFEVDTDALGIPTELVVKGLAGVPASLPGFVRMMGVPANLLRKFVTRNPLYLARQLARDPVSAYLTTGVNFNPITTTISGVTKSLSGTADTTLERRGITGGMLYAEDFTDYDRIQKLAKGNPSLLGYLMYKADEATHAVDAVARNAVYEGAIRQGASEMQATLAAYEAMPFAKRGVSPSVRYLSHMVPFLSAAIQGWDVMYRAAIGDMPMADKVNIRNKLIQRGLMIGAMSFMYAMAMQDDEQYKNANTSERLNNWFVKLPGLDQTIKIPVPFEMGVVVKMIPEALARTLIADKDIGKEFKDIFSESLWNQIPNVVIPQAVKPMVETFFDKSFFSGRDIEGKGLKQIDIGQRHDTNTSELSKLFGFDVNMFGTQLGVSPKQLEYVLGQYTAGIYPALAALVDNLLPAPTAAKPDRTLADLPMLSSVLLKENAGGEINRLYDQIEMLARQAATFKKLVETDPKKAREYAETNRQEIALGNAANKVKAALDKFSMIENKIRISPEMGSATKKEALDRIRNLKTQMARKYSEMLRI